LDLKDEFEDLSRDVEETSLEMEPYRNRGELTKAQEKRQEWFDSTMEELDEIVYSLDEANCSLEVIMEE